jgi:hypothetical protein
MDLFKKIAVARAQELQANDYNVATDQGGKPTQIDLVSPN